MRRYLSAATAVLAMAACGDSPTADSSGSAAAEGSAAGVAAAPSGAQGAQRAAAAPATTPGARGSGAFAGRTGELVNPDDSTMVLLYYDLAGIAPPIDIWVEADNRVTFAPAIEKAARRAAVRAEIESAAAAVRGVGTIRLSMNANLSDYDPTYGEFTVRALSPSSAVSFHAFDQNVSLRFGNGRLAQVWHVPAAEAGLIRDKISYGHNASLDALLRLTAVQPGPAGGTITSEVLEYELRDNRNGSLLGRVRLARD